MPCPRRLVFSRGRGTRPLWCWPGPWRCSPRGPLSVAGVAVLAVLADAAKSAWWQVSAWSAAVSALWLGLLSVAYPGHLGSVGRIGGVAAIVWGAALAVGTVINHPTLRHPIVPSVS